MKIADIKALTPIEQARLMLQMLDHDGHGGNHIMMLSKEKKIIYHGEPDPARAVASDADAYVSINRFRSARTKRLNKNVYALTAIAVDIDFGRDMDSSALKSEHARAVEVMADAAAAGTFRTPTAVVCSGTGLWVFFVLKNSVPASSEKACRLYDKVRSTVFSKMDRILKKNRINAHVDPACSDYARLTRLPGSTNQKNAETARFLSYSGETYNLAEITRLSNAGGRPRREKSVPKPVTVREQPRAQIIQFNDRSYYFLHRKRLNLIKGLILARKSCVGCRETMLFVAHQELRQIYAPGDAENELRKLNAMFRQPLGPEELEHILTEKPEGVYKYSNRKIFSLLGVTREEIDAYYISYTDQRNRQREERRKAKAELRHRILRMIHADEPYTAIALATGVSLSTVKRISKAEGIRRYGGSIIGLAEISEPEQETETVKEVKESPDSKVSKPLNNLKIYRGVNTKGYTSTNSITTTPVRRFLSCKDAVPL